MKDEVAGGDGVIAGARDIKAFSIFPS